MICAQCGEYTLRPEIRMTADPAAAVAICERCGSGSPFRRFPLWWVTGSSGAGKSTLTPLLRPYLPGWVVFEGEVVDYWRYGNAGGYADLYDQWLRVAAEIAANQPPVLMIAMALPEQLAACPAHSSFTVIHMLALVSDPGIQRARLVARPSWRRTAGAAFVRAQLAYTDQLKALTDAPGSALTALDTSACDLEATATAMTRWARACRT